MIASIRMSEYLWPKMTGADEMIAAYVPNAEFFTFMQALDWALERDKEAAEMLMESLLSGEVI